MHSSIHLFAICLPSSSDAPVSPTAAAASLAWLPARPAMAQSPPRMECLPAARASVHERFIRLDEGQDIYIGKGGFGKVYQGWDRLAQRIVAVKRQPAKGQSLHELAVFDTLRIMEHKANTLLIFM